MILLALCDRRCRRAFDEPRKKEGGRLDVSDEAVH